MITFPRPSVDSRSEWGIVPFVTHRKGEHPAPAADLHVLTNRNGGVVRLMYRDEDPRDRPVRDVLWARCSFSHDDTGMPTGEPMWKYLHPYRQMITMLSGRCQICTRPARTPLGWIFLAGPKDQDPDAPLIVTAQPPVCRRHVRMAAALCRHMEGNPMVFLAGSAPLYGVLGSVYGWGPNREFTVIEAPDGAVRFNDPRIPTMLASQLVRRLSSFRVLDVDGLLAALEATDAH
ncbi:hypothetical protein [Streptomyces sp. AGS-58]|uniref:hypothetical protein n=1 Tax=unclassified Streptomyces TaxID=2593676 RepID=UPI0035A2D0C3